MRVLVTPIALVSVLVISGGSCEFNRSTFCEIQSRSDFDEVGDSCGQISVTDSTLLSLDGIETIRSTNEFMTLYVMRNPALNDINAILAGRYENMRFVNNPRLQRAEFYRTGASIRLQNNAALQQVVFGMGGAGDRAPLPAPQFLIQGESMLREVLFFCDAPDCEIQEFTIESEQRFGDPTLQRPLDDIVIETDGSVHVQSLRLAHFPLSSLEPFFDLQVDTAVRIEYLDGIDEAAVDAYVAALDARDSTAEVTWCQEYIPQACSVVRERRE